MTATTEHVHVHRDDPDTSGRRDQLGVLLLIFADIVFVGSLIFSYLYLRFLNTTGAWLPEGEASAPPATTWIVIGCMLVGALVYGWGARQLRSGQLTPFGAASWCAVLAAVVALVFQIVQMATFNFPLAESGRYTSTYSSMMLVLAGANAFHLLLTVVISVGIANRARLGLYRDPASWQPRLAVYWWWWVAISAIIVGLMTTFLVASPYLPSVPPAAG